MILKKSKHFWQVTSLKDILGKAEGSALKHPII
jgi:hypothetical protein